MIQTKFAMTSVWLLTAAAVAAFSAGSALAADLTGTWKGGFRCTSLDNSGKKHVVVEKKSVLKIDQNEDGTFDAEIDDFPYCGRMITSKKNSKKGVGILVGPDSDADPTTYSELEHLSWKLNSGKKKSDKINKLGVWVDGNSIGHCTGSWKRKSKEVPVMSFFSCFPGPF
jgi:hypothetical protein